MKICLPRLKLLFVDVKQFHGDVFVQPAKRGSLGMPMYKGIEQSTALTSTKYRFVAIKAVLRRHQVPDLKALRRHLEKSMVFV